MTKRKRKNLVTIISLLVVFALMLGFYIWYINRDILGSKDTAKDENASGTDTSITIATMDPKLINRIHFQNENADMIFLFEDDVWVYELDRNRPIKQNYVQNIINLVDEIKTYRIVNEKPEDLNQYGLGSPYAFVEVTQTDGKTVALSVGNAVTGADGYYARLEGDDRVFIVPAIYGTQLSYSDTNMTQVEHGPNIVANNIYHVEVLQEDKEDFEVIYDPDSIYDMVATPLFSWVILKPYEGVYSADTAKVLGLLENYSTFSFFTCEEYDAKDLSEYGLENPKASIFVEYYEQYEQKIDEPTTDPNTGEEVSSTTIKEEKSFKLYVGNMNDKGDYFVRKDGDNAVYTMKASNIDMMLTVDAFSILNTFVNIYNISTVNKIDIDIKGKPYTMEIKRKTIINDEGEEEIESTYYYMGKITEEDIFKDVYQVMIGAKIDSRLNQEISADDLDPILTLEYYIEGKDEPIRTKYYSYDDSFYLIDNGYATYFVADKRRIDSIITAIEEFKLIEN